MDPQKQESYYPGVTHTEQVQGAVDGEIQQQGKRVPGADHEHGHQGKTHNDAVDSNSPLHGGPGRPDKQRI